MPTSCLCRFCLALALLAATASPLRALDFTLHRVQATSGALQTTKTYFLDGDSKIFIDIPLDWKVTDSAAMLDCLPASTNGHVVIEQAGSKPWHSTNLARSSCANVRRIPFLKGQRRSRRYPSRRISSRWMAGAVWRSRIPTRFFGQQMHRAVVFFNLPEKRVWQATITAPEADFAKLHEQTRLMLYDLFEPEKMLTGAALQRYRDGITD